MKLLELLTDLEGYRRVGSQIDLDIAHVRDDSRAIEPGDLFVAVRGRSSDGHEHIASAIERGAIAVVVDHEVADCHVTQIVVADTALALGSLVGRWYGSPAASMMMIGVTGTNGKTTTTFLLESIVLAAGGKPGVIGTVTYRWAGKSIDAPYTTPTPEVLHQTLTTMRDAGCTHVIMEVSSAALIMGRLGGVQFQVAGFSNLTQDHLDVHGTMDAYRDAKRLLFTQHLAGGIAVVNVDDEAGEYYAGAVDNSRVMRVSTVADRAADIRMSNYESSVRGIAGTIETSSSRFTIESKPLVGAYNVANIALAVGISIAAGISHEHIAAGIAALSGVPGRVERVANDADLDILVDYAHTPDALTNVLSALRPLTKRRLICVFGCGGDRDPSKRPKMGAAVAALADLAIVTSDNPRTEDPQTIIDAILPAVPKPFFVSTDRRTAIAAAVAEATPGDIVLIAGKGHEDYQILGKTKIHFDDREQAEAAVHHRPRFHLNSIAASLGASRSLPDVIASRVVIDSRHVAPGDLYVAIVGEKLNGNDFVADAFNAGAVAALVRRSDATRVNASLTNQQQQCVVVVDDPRDALGKIAQGHRQRWGQDRSRRLIAITGSAGKTTTKELTRAAVASTGVTHAAQGSLNNETGVPLTLLGLRDHHRYAVLEMGMRGAGQIAYLTAMAEPDVAVVVNAGTAHIELLGSTDAIAAAKGEIWQGLAADGTVVRPVDDVRLRNHAHSHRPGAMTITFGDGPEAIVRLSDYRATGPGSSTIELEIGSSKIAGTIPMMGRHSAIDAACAVAAAMAAGVAAKDAVRGIASARNAGMRGEVVDIAGRHVIVDCYNANPASMAASLKMLAELSGAVVHGARPALAIVGDMLELGDFAAQAHADVGRLIDELNLGVIALGQWRNTVAEHAVCVVAVTDDPVEAARKALSATTVGDWILLKASRGMRLERVLDAMRQLALTFTSELS
jgi:MurE/MurF fusion protein